MNVSSAASKSLNFFGSKTSKGPIACLKCGARQLSSRQYQSTKNWAALGGNEKTVGDPNQQSLIALARARITAFSS
jgi:hypothetical protein